MRSLRSKVDLPVPDACGVLAWGGGGLRHKIGHGVRPACSASDRDEVAYSGSDHITRTTAQAARIAALRQGLAKLERAHAGPPAHLSLGVGEMHAHLPGPGLACGVLHEIAAAAHGDRPAAFGFIFALTAAALHARPGPG